MDIRNFASSLLLRLNEPVKSQFLDFFGLPSSVACAERSRSIQPKIRGIFVYWQNSV
jgi:hypothetical protein